MSDPRRSRGFITFAALLLAGAAAGCVPHQAFDRAAASGLTSIVVPPPGQPHTLEAFDAGNPGFLFGVVGAVIGASVENERGDRFTAAVHQGGSLNLSKEISDRVVDELNKDGYQARAYDVAPARSDETAFYSDYAPFRVLGAGAVLDIAVFDAGYRSSAFRPYLPSIWARVRLVTIEDGRTIYAQIISYGSHLLEGYSAGSPDDSCKFPSEEALTANVPRAIECLRIGARAIAHAIAVDLSRR